jgi:hypothetical protein
MKEGMKEIGREVIVVAAGALFMGLAKVAAKVFENWIRGSK